MPKTRRAKLPIKTLAYKEYDSSSDEEDHHFETIASILGFFTQSKSAQKRRSSVGKTPKKKRQSTACTCHGPKKQQKKKGSPQKQQKKAKGHGANTAKVSALLEENKTFVIESDDETAAITTTQTDVIKNKVDSFFKDLESDEELEENLESKNVPSNLPDKNSRDFYTLSDSDNDEENKKRQRMIADLTKDIASPKPSTSGSGSVFNTGSKIVADNSDINPEKNVEDLFAYVDNVLNEYDQVVDITEDSPKENVLVMSLEDLKKKTDEILGEVTSLIDTLKPKEPEKIPVESPVKEAPMCPVCFEPFGSSRQAMATLCGHMFCNPCILEIVKKTKKCPTCRKGLTKTKYHPIYI